MRDCATSVNQLWDTYWGGQKAQSHAPDSLQLNFLRTPVPPDSCFVSVMVAEDFVQHAGQSFPGS